MLLPFSAYGGFAMTYSELPSTPGDSNSPLAAAAATVDPRRKQRQDGLLSPFRVRNFRLLFGGQLTSNVGDAFYAVALPWYLLSHGGPEALGLVLLAYGVPRTLCVVAGGALADRLRPRRLMLLADVARTIIMATFAILIGFFAPPLWQLAALSVGYGAFSGLFLPPSTSIIPDLLPDDALQAGNSLSSVSTQFAGLVGPSLGGLIVGFFAPWVALLADAGTFLISALSLGAMRQARRPAEPAAAIPSEPGAGEDAAVPQEPHTFWQLLRSSPLLQVVLTFSILGNVSLGGLTEVAFPALLKGPFHATATQYGLALGGFALGALAGGLSAGLLGRLPRRGIFIAVVWFTQAIVLALIPYVGGITGATALLAVLGLANGSSNVFIITAIQQRMPGALLGRVMGAIIFTSLGLYPLSVAGAGYLVESYGPSLLFPVSGVLVALAVVLAVSRRDIRQL
jgi:predicted MFS family arabinose efflux permease